MGKGALGRVYRDGEIVVRQGERDNCMHVIQEGLVEVFLERDGKELPLSVCGEGEIVGEMAIFDRAAHCATVRARGEARLLTVDKKGFLKRVQEDPSLAFHILKNMSARIREMSEKVARYQEKEAGGQESAGPTE